MTESTPEIILKPGREGALRRHHPWIFSGALGMIPTGLIEGDIVAVRGQGGEKLGFGHFSSGSIAIKMLSFEETFIRETFLDKKITRAIGLRKTLGLFNNPSTTGFRLINAEGDGLPGLIVDFYAGTAVIQFHSVGMFRLREELVAVLKKILGDSLSAIYDKSKELGGADAASNNGYLWGEAKTVEFSENELNFIADWEHGQKTGFFLDQRENRKLLGTYSKNRNVLNCFSYTGGFSVYALAGGAAHVTSVDTSSTALTILEKNIARNFEQPAHRAVEADCLQYLQKLDRDYDVIILDPPAFIKHRAALRSGIKGYETINHLALKQIKNGGLLFTFSCSQLLSRGDFYDQLVRAALRAGREVRVLFELRQAPCHPVSPFHPEGEYLKGLVLEVD